MRPKTATQKDVGSFQAERRKYIKAKQFAARKAPAEWNVTPKSGFGDTGIISGSYFESGNDAVNWRFLPETGEVLWWSERSNWGHLYLYDLATGSLKRPVTGGDWIVHQLRHVDRATRTLYFTASGREPADPYFEYFYSVSMDGGAVTLLTPDSAHHTITLSPDRSYFVDAASTPVAPGSVVVRDMGGRERVALERGDISRETWWSEALRRSILRDDFDPEEEKKRLEEEEEEATRRGLEMMRQQQALSTDEEEEEEES